MAVDSNGSERSSVRDAHGDVVDSPSGPQLSNQRAIGFRLILMLESTSSQVPLAVDKTSTTEQRSATGIIKNR
jgi:hypothetical protein